MRDTQNSEVSELGDESDIETMFSEEPSIFNEMASPEVKLDFEPVIEEVLRRKELGKKPIVTTYFVSSGKRNPARN